MLLLIAVCVLPSAVGAAPFPPKTDEVVQDEERYLDEQEKQSFAEFVKQYPELYKLVVVESVEPEAVDADEYARKLYDHYNLPEHSLMIVLDMTTRELGVYPGPALQEQGADMEMLQEKIETYYQPFSREEKYLQGIQTFVAETRNELERIAATPTAQTGSEVAADSPAVEGQTPASLWSVIPWWVYVLAVVFLLFLIALLVAFLRRNAVFAEVDRVEDWKDELVEKIQAIDLDKPLRRATGATEEWYAQLANRKENLLRMKVPDVEMIILEAEEACERLRFRAARELLAEGEELLTALEAEVAALKADSAKVVERKNEYTHQLPELEKLAEQCGRKLTNARLDYGLTFHVLKDQLDKAEKLRGKVKELLAAGDVVKAHELTNQAQVILQRLSQSLERLPELVKRVQNEMVGELKQLEDDIGLLVRDGYVLNQSQLEATLLPVKQLLISAESSLEEGNLEHVEMHLQAFAIKLDEAYQSLEEAVLSQRQAASAAASPQSASQTAAELDLASEGDVSLTALHTAPAEANDPNEGHLAEGERAQSDELVTQPEAKQAATRGVSVDFPLADEKTDRDAAGSVNGQSGVGTAGMGGSHSPWEEERRLLLSRMEEMPASGGAAERPTPAADSSFAAESEQGNEQQVEYELVIPKSSSVGMEQAVVEPPQAEAICIESEDDALDMIEHISNSLLRIRQQLKRGYLPGIPEDVAFHFEQVVQALGRIKLSMEQYGYELQEVAEMLLEAREELLLTQQLAEAAIRDCQRAEGAIQYTNRYRRQNRQVHELLSKAEQAFRQLRFAEAFSLAEEARLLVEAEDEQTSGRTSWFLRRKGKGAGEE